MLAAPRFHHLHLNSCDPDAAIRFLHPAVRQHLENELGRLSGAGFAERCAHSVQQARQRPADRTAVGDLALRLACDRRAQIARGLPGHGRTCGFFRSTPPTKAAPSTSAATPGRAPAASRADQGADRRGQGQGHHARRRRWLRATCRGQTAPSVEYLGDQPVERMNHVHLWQEQPFCAQLWYRKHLDATPVAGRGPATPRTEADCTVERGPDPSWPSLTREGLFRNPAAPPSPSAT